MNGQTKNMLAGLTVILSAALMIWSGRECAAESAKAVTLCLTVMIPSLYAFTALSKLLISSGAYRLGERLFSPVSRYVFRLPEEFFPVFLISQLAGYPIGAALISGMEEEGRLTKKQAEQYLCFCISPGPAFITAVSAAAAPALPQAWKTVMLSVTGANIILALLTAPFRPLPEKNKEPFRVKFTAEMFTDSVFSAAKSMAMICGMIIFMAAAMGIMAKAGILSALSVFFGRLAGSPSAQVYPFIRAFFEISGLSGIFGEIFETLPTAAGLLGFGGLCVHMQIKAVCKRFSCAKALLLRIPCGITAYFICKGFMPKLWQANAVTVMAEINRQPAFGDFSPLLSIFLLIMTILILSQKSMVKSEKI